MDRVRRVDRPTTIITDAVQRIDLRNTAYDLAARGEYGPVVQKGVQRSLPGKYPLSAAQQDVINHISLIKPNPVAPEIAPIPQDPEVLTRHIKAVGYFLKADLMGTCRVPEFAYYSHDKQGNPIDARYENAIVIVMRKEWNAVHASTGSDWMGDPISFQAYQHLGMVAETIANYIRRLGWDAAAQYGPSFVNRYSVLLPPLLLLAGIGEVSRTGIILNPFLGLGFKAAAVLTNMPIIPDKPIDFGLQNFCQNCNICAQNCPSRAIPMGDKVMYNGYETWKLDTRRCASFNFTNKNGTMCNRCVKSCPWTNPPTWFHNLVRVMVMHSRLAQLIAIRAVYFLGLGKDHPDSKWWFDMEYEDNVIRSRE
ncbi:MAG: reductive dehalogenase [Anaerolineae bacterium]|jgi:reductive dehalogenase|nr:reductive dehalogenase [Anaerolineae bacterium]MDH7474603.1 reductive dehalogenase [Anaerolineae bacterium]